MRPDRLILSKAKCIVNGIWIFCTAGLIAARTDSKALGVSLFLTYVAVIIVCRPMSTLILSLKTVSLDTTPDRQARNKAFTCILLAVKVLLLTAMVGIAVSGLILPQFLLWKLIAPKIHFLCVCWAFILASLQFGINLRLFLSRIQKKTVVIGSQIGCWFMILSGGAAFTQSQYGIALFSLESYEMVFSAFQMVLIGIGFSAIGYLLMSARSLSS